MMNGLLKALVGMLGRFAGPALVLVALGGCGAGPEPLPLPEVAPPPADVSDAAPLTPGDLMALAVGRTRFVLNRSDEEERGEPVLQRVTALGDGLYQMTYEGLRTETVGIDDAGQLVVFAEEEYDQQVRTTYEPAMPVLPAELVHGATLAGEVAMVVADMESGKVRDRGTCTYQVTVAREGEPEGGGVRVQTRRQIDLSLARAQVDAVGRYVPKLGLMREVIEQKIWYLGLVPSESRQVLVREDAVIAPAGE